MPSTSPVILSRVKRSIPSSTESASTSSGTMVSMIEPSIGEVIDKPYMMKTLRNTPISSAASTARYSASLPDETGILRTKSPSVPKTVIDIMSMRRGSAFFIKIPRDLTEHANGSCRLS